MLNIGNQSSKYVKIWEIQEVAEKFVKAKASTGRKDTRNEGQFINTNWFVTFVGQAKSKAESLQKGDTIEITNGGIENPYNKEQGRSYLNVTIFDFETTYSANPTAQSGGQDDFNGFQAIDGDDDIPY